MLSGNSKNSRATTRFHPYPMLSLFDEVNRFFEDTLPVARSTRAVAGFNPPMDVTENEKEYIVKGEFPGLSSSELQIEVRENAITVSGEKRHEHEKREGSRHYGERAFGSFSRTISFDSEIDEDNASAELKDGVLTIKAPKAANEARGAKRLSIKTA